MNMEKEKMMKHTQGKWSVKAQSGMLGIGVVSVHTKVDDKKIFICDLPARDIKEAKANANLIANAPEMLSALKEISNLELDNGFNDWSVALKDWAQRVGKIAEEAIAKAEGK